MMPGTGREKLLVTSEYPPNTTGGIQRTSVSFVDFAVNQADFDVVWTYPCKKRKSATKDIESGSHIKYEPMRSVANLPVLEKFPDQESSLRMANIINSGTGFTVIYSPDIIGMTVFDKQTDLQKKKTTLIWNCPIDITLRDVDSSSMRDYIAYLISSPLYNTRNRMLRDRKMVDIPAVFNSYAIKKSFDDIFPKALPKEWVVIPPTGEFCHDCRLEKENIDGDFTVLTVGRITAKKGTGRILNLATHMDTVLQDTGKNVRFFVVGDFQSSYGLWFAKEAEKINGTLSHCKVELAGYVPDGDQLCQIYCNSDLFFQPSTIEGLSLVFSEAASHGLPLLGFNIRGSGEAIAQFAEAGFLVESPTKSEYEKLADKIKTIIGYPLERRNMLSQLAKTTALREFSPPAVNLKMLDFITRNGSTKK